MPKFFTLTLSKKKGQKVKVHLYAEDYIPERGEKVQIIGMFVHQSEAEHARKSKGNRKLERYWGKGRYLEYRNGMVRFSSAASRREFFARFVR